MNEATWCRRKIQSNCRMSDVKYFLQTKKVVVSHYVRPIRLGMEKPFSYILGDVHNGTLVFYIMEIKQNPWEKGKNKQTKNPQCFCLRTPLVPCDICFKNTQNFFLNAPVFILNFNTSTFRDSVFWYLILFYIWPKTFCKPAYCLLFSLHLCLLIFLHIWIDPHQLIYPIYVNQNMEHIFSSKSWKANNHLTVNPVSREAVEGTSRW